MLEKRKEKAHGGKIVRNLFSARRYSELYNGFVFFQVQKLSTMYVEETSSMMVPPVDNLKNCNKWIQHPAAVYLVYVPFQFP